MKRNTRRCFSLSWLLLFLTVGNSGGQPFENYKPRKPHSAASQHLLDTISLSMKLELNSMRNAPNFEVLRWLNTMRTVWLQQLVRSGVFIQDDTLENLVNNVMRRLNGTALRTFPRKVLITDSPTVDAACFGQGIYFITVGLLARISSEDELAFTLAHEMGHDDLYHVKSRIIRETEIKVAKKKTDQEQKVQDGTVGLEDIGLFRELIYEVQRHNRKEELQADSMGVVILQRAGYRERAASSLVDILEQPTKPKYDPGVEIFLPLNADAYPLREYWFRKQLSVYSRQPSDISIFPVDSVLSHSEASLRKSNLEQYYPPDGVFQATQRNAFDETILMAEFEAAESAYRNNAYDRCLYQCLQLWTRFPANTYLLTTIGKVLTQLYDVKNNNNQGFGRYVPRYTSNYSNELVLVNNFLYNLTTREIGELTYYFLSNPAHFNSDVKAHYYLLWKICGSTHRRDEKEKVARNFKNKFGKKITRFAFKTP